VTVSGRATRLLGNPVTTATSRVLIGRAGRRLPVLAFHAVPDPERLQGHVRYLVERYRVLSAEQVEAALATGMFPRRGVWITFDDGDPSVFTEALPVLDDLGATATAYVCPGVIGTREPFWWEIVRASTQAGISAAVAGHDVPSTDLEVELKRRPDPVRRAVVERLRTAVEEQRGAPLEREQATEEQLRAWVASGHGIGNHTWDHPCLDRCSEEQQVRQVEAAHARLEATLDERITTFAYPNGNWAAATEATLQRLGYRTAVGFDHRLARTDRPALRISRLRLDADADAPRRRAVVTGAHGAALALRSRARSNGAPDPRDLP
jgi:peptidoglycan/xylan/chitin deacetylase (PgdA/CDA1 family)